MLRMIVRPFSILAMLAAAVHAQQRPLQLEDYYRIRDVGNPELSPDGKWVAFTVGTRVEATNLTTLEVWLVSADGAGSPTRVSGDGVSASAPSWRDDGRLRYTVSGRAIVVDPSRPDQPDSSATDSARARATSIVSPDGKWIATLRDVAVAKRAKAAVSDFERRAEDHFKGVQFDWLPFASDGRPFPLPNRFDPEVNPAQELFVGPADAPAQGRQLTTLGLRPTSLDWSADGKAVVFVADSNYRNERKYGRTELWSVSVSDGVLKRLTKNSTYDYSGAKLSPDGKWILSTRGLADDYVIAKKLSHGGATDLVLVAPDGGKEINLTADWDLLPSQPFWSTDGKYIYFTGGIGGTTHLLRVSAGGGAVEQVTRGDRRLAAFSFDKAQRRMAFVANVMERPAEIAVASIDGSGERQLTHVNDAVMGEFALNRVEHVQFKSKDGTPIEGWLWWPADYRAGGRPGPHSLVVSSHGGPHAADGYGFNFKNHLFAASNYFVLVTNFRSSTGYGEKFLWGTWGAWGTKDGQDVISGVDYAVAHHPIDVKRVAAMGHSYGGFMTNWLITQYPERFAAAIPGAGIVNWMSDYGNADIPITKEKEFWGAPWDPKARETMLKQSPLVYANRVKAPTLFIIGEIDQRVPYSETQQMYVALRKNGVPAKVIRYANMPHSISGHWNQVHRMMNERAWLNQYLRGVVP